MKHQSNRNLFRIIKPDGNALYVDPAHVVYFTEHTYANERRLTYVETTAPDDEGDGAIATEEPLEEIVARYEAHCANEEVAS